jgi:tetratricopeptide (TPR) repeat protein
MIYGWMYLYGKNRPAAVFLVSLVLLTTVGMVFYMNFADGNRPERYDYEQWVKMGQPGPMPTVHREVRVRDYFFTAGFMYFGMWVGLAASCLLHMLFETKKTVTALFCAILLAVSPAIPAINNYERSTRNGDWVAYDYAYNLLNSCEENGIIFTNGDNDTFPLWALQEAYGVRKDVRVVNLSLLNTDWYIKQLQKLEPQVPISYTAEEIEKLQPQLNPFQEPRNHTLRNAGITIMLPGIKTRRALRVQDLMVLNIVDATKWTKPIYFAMTVSEDNLMGLEPYLQAQGLVYKLMPQRVTAENHYDLDRTLYVVDSVFSLKGIGNAKLNDTSRRLLTNYLQIAYDLRRPLSAMKRNIDALKTLETAAEASETDTANSENLVISEDARTEIQKADIEYQEKMATATRFLDRCVDMMPWDWRPRMIRHDFLMDQGMFDEAIDLMERAIGEDPENSEQYRTLLDQARLLKERG